MMTQMMRMLIGDRDEATNPNVKKAYATLSSVAGILLNLCLCTAKIGVGRLSRSMAIQADGFNNLSDAGTSLVSLLGFQIAAYGGGSAHPFGHGRMEWIMGIFASLAVLLMGVHLAEAAVDGILHPEALVFSPAAVAVLALSILVKVYMYSYNRKFAKITGSEALKATASDCVSDSAATVAVLVSTVVSHFTGYGIDGYCGVLVSLFIMLTGAKSLWEVLGRIMGKAMDEDMKETIVQMTKTHPEITAVYQLMIHDYGFGYFVVSMKISGCQRDGEQLYVAANQIAYELYRRYGCDAFISVEHLREDEALEHALREQIHGVMKRYGAGLEIEHFRLIENGDLFNVAFDLIYPAALQRRVEELFIDIENEIKARYPACRTVIRGSLRRGRLGVRTVSV